MATPAPAAASTAPAAAVAPAAAESKDVKAGADAAAEVKVAPVKRRFEIPWNRQILHGLEVLRNPRYNKGMAFTLDERRELRIEGLLPPVVITQEVQVARVVANIRKQATDLDRYTYLMGLYQRNERLFYRVLIDNVTELLPIVYTPTVGLACQKFGHLFKTPIGMYFTLRDRGNIANILANWPERNVRAIVFTDGERILGLGDLGAYGMGIPIGKLSLYTACAGIDPRLLLPVTIDVGTNNKSLLEDVHYTGIQAPRAERKEYDELIDEFMTAAQQMFGSTVLLQFEDFANQNAFRLLSKYQDRCCTFNDDIQGTASVVLAGVFAALRPTEKKLSEHRFLFFGAGSAGIGIANLIALAMTQEEKMTMDEARARIWLVDSKGLVTPTSALNAEKKPFAHPNEPIAALHDIVDHIKPTAIIGCTAQPQTFTKEVCEGMAKYSKRPMIFALSNPTSKAECTAEQAYQWTNGAALFSSGSPFPPVTLHGKTYVPGQGNNSYIFPGLALGIIATGARRVTDNMFYIAAKTLAAQVSDEDLASGTLYPPMRTIRKCSGLIAAAVAEEVYARKLASHVPKPADMHAFVCDQMYDTSYPTYIH